MFHNVPSLFPTSVASEETKNNEREEQLAKTMFLFVSNTIRDTTTLTKDNLAPDS
jgi:hypothetical protein